MRCCLPPLASSCPQTPVAVMTRNAARRGAPAARSSRVAWRSLVMRRAASDLRIVSPNCQKIDWCFSGAGATVPACLTSQSRRRRASNSPISSLGRRPSASRAAPPPTRPAARAIRCATLCNDRLTTATGLTPKRQSGRTCHPTRRDEQPAAHSVRSDGLVGLRCGYGADRVVRTDEAITSRPAWRASGPRWRRSALSGFS